MRTLNNWEGFNGILNCLANEIKFFLSHEFKTDETRKKEYQRLINAYNRASKYPILEISSNVWDKMNDLAELALITNCNSADID